MLKLFRNRSGFFKDSLTLISGMSLAQSIPFLISPILTRLYSPDEFGAYAIYAALTGVLAVIVTGRYEPAILLPESQKDAEHVTVLAIMITFLVSVTSLVLIIFLNHEIVTAFNVPEISSFLYLVPFSLLFIGLTQTYTYYLNRSKKYGTISTAKLTQTTTLAGGQIGFGYFGLSSSGLILGTVLGSAAGWLHLKIKSKLARISKKNFSPDVIRKMARRYENFPKINAPHAFTNSLSSRFPVFFLSSFFGSSIAGFFSLSTQVSLQPVKVVAAAIGQVFSRTISEKYNQGENIHQFTRQTVLRLAAIAIIPFIAVIIIAPGLFEIIFGSEWRIAGEYTQVLLPSYFMVFIVSPTVFIPAMLGKQKKAFIIELIYLALRFSAIMVGVVLNTAYLALILYSVTGICVQLYLINWILRISKENS
ncbi:MAG: lipopolysaccharide biosynthesis protein [Balneolales bacterium]